MLLMIEKGIRGRICHAIHRHAKPNNKYMKNYSKDIKSLYLMYLDATISIDGERLMPVNSFKWIRK